LKYIQIVTAFNRHGAALTDQQKLEIYTNHVKSYLVEEYIRWFTDVNLDETRFYHYSPMSYDVKLIENSYQTFIKSAAAATGQKKIGNVTATFKDPVSGQDYKIYTDTKEQNYASSAVKRSQRQDDNAKFFDIEMTETMRSYFSRETLLMPFEDIVSRVAYPRKFDRTFSVIFDPDEFIVDVTDIRNGNDNDLKNAVDKMVADGFLLPNAPSITGYQQKNLYRQKEMTQEDVYMDEYFVTIEPYLGTNNYTG